MRVVRGVEEVVQRHRQLDDTEARPEMAARHRDRVDRFRAQLVGELVELVFLELAEVGRRVDRVEEGCLRICHLASLRSVPRASARAPRRTNLCFGQERVGRPKGLNIEFRRERQRDPGCAGPTATSLPQCWPRQGQSPKPGHGHRRRNPAYKRLFSNRRDTCASHGWTNAPDPP